MPKKNSNSRGLKAVQEFSEEQDLDGFDGEAAERNMKSAKSFGSRSSGGGSRKNKDKKQSFNDRGSKQESKIGSSTIEKVSCNILRQSSLHGGTSSSLVRDLRWEDMLLQGGKL